MKKLILMIPLLTITMGLSAWDIVPGASIKTSGEGLIIRDIPEEDEVRNRPDFKPRYPFRSKPNVAERDTGLKLESRFFGTWYAGSMFIFSWDLQGAVSNLAASSNQTLFTPRLDEFAVQATLPGNLSLTLGRRNFAMGEGLLTNPSNLVDPSAAFTDALSFWQAEAAWFAGAWSFSAVWLPALFADPPAEGDKIRDKWKGFLNSNETNILSVKTSWFGYPVNLGAAAYLREQSAWTTTDYDAAGAITGTWNLLPSLILKGEFLLDTDLEYSHRDIKALAAITLAPDDWLEINTEYYYNSTGEMPDKYVSLAGEWKTDSSNDAGKPSDEYGSLVPFDPLNWGRHFIFVLARMDFPEWDLSIRPSVLISAEDASLRQGLEFKWLPNESFTFFAEYFWFTGPENGLFNEVPITFKAAAGVSYAL